MYGDGGSDAGGVSRRGRKANVGFGRCATGLLGRRWARCGGCHGCGAAGSFGLGAGESQHGFDSPEGVGDGDAMGEVAAEEPCELPESDSGSKGKSPIGTPAK